MQTWSLGQIISGSMTLTGRLSIKPTPQLNCLVVSSLQKLCSATQLLQCIYTKLCRIVHCLLL
jgi:hypothetical protein